MTVDELARLLAHDTLDAYLEECGDDDCRSCKTAKNITLQIRAAARSELIERAQRIGGTR